MRKLTGAVLLVAALLAAATRAMAQPNDYKNNWEKVDGFLLKGLPKSALEEVQNIYNLANKTGNQVQQVKALVYTCNLKQDLEEESGVKTIDTIVREAEAAKEPTRQLLYSIAADAYLKYYQQNRWKMYERGITTNADPTNPATWTAPDFHSKIAWCYQQSLANPTMLQKHSLTQYEPIVLKGNTRPLRPTLYHLLAHKALDFFKSDEIEVIQPSYAFKLADAACLAPAKQFVRYQYNSKDTSSYKLKAIRLYQDIIAFNLQEAAEGKSAAPLLDADVDRIQFAYEHKVGEGKDRLYKEALEHLCNTYPAVPEAMQAGYLLAQWWQNKGNAYKPDLGTREDEMALAQALKIAEAVAARFPKSEGGINALNLATELKQPALTIETEKVNLPGKPFRALLSFKNTSKVWLRIVPRKARNQVDADDEYRYAGDDWWKSVIGQQPTKSWQLTMPAYTDLRSHSVEIKVDDLPLGEYVLLVSGKENFSLNDNPLGSSSFYISNISYAHSNENLFVLHRSTGKPLNAITVNVWHYHYDYQTRREKGNIVQTLKTDANGYAKIATDNTRGANMRFEFIDGKDRLFITDHQYMGRSYYAGDQHAIKQNEFEADNASFYIFTDRSLYRPGQLVYFKAIGVTKDFQTGRSKLYLHKAALLVELHDANYQKVDSLSLKQNDYGSIQGSFRLPSSGATGQFSLAVTAKNTSTQQFRVEEYKRPKFYVEFPSLKESYRLNEKVKVTGMAKAYVGNNIDGAQVKYRVFRQTRLPWPIWGRYSWPAFNSEKTEIAFGETSTKADGSFDITFNALPDLSVDKKNDPVFDFTIEADVTDLNGETRSGTQNLSIGYKALSLAIEMVQDTKSAKPIALENEGPELYEAGNLTALKVSPTNLAGFPQQVASTIKLYALEGPGRLIRKRYWPAPDTFMLKQDEFLKLFPTDEYRTENDVTTWKRGRMIESANLLAGDTNGMRLAAAKLKPGYYIAEATATEKDGNEVKTVTWFGLYDMATNVMPAPGYLYDLSISSTAEPGQAALFAQGTTTPGLYVVQEIVKQQYEPGGRNQPVSTFSFENLNAGFASNSFIATEQDRGGYMVNRFFVIDNRLYSTNWWVDVPWTNKELNIRLETFRDKLLPGQQETWKVKITGAKGEQVAAELLAGMYDASLDQFYAHKWQPMKLWPIHYAANGWRHANNFAIGSTSQKTPYRKPQYFEKRFDQLVSLGDGPLRIRIRGMNSMGRDALVGAAPGLQVANAEAAPPIQEDYDKVFTKVDIASYRSKEAQAPGLGNEEKAPPPAPSNTIRRNFNETAFFFPTLQADADGIFTFSFTMPEALTQWKLQMLAHTKDLATGTATHSVVTQKDLMVQPNAPRFFRQGDKLEFVAKITNLSASSLSGKAELKLFRASSMEPVDKLFTNNVPSLTFDAPAGQSVAVKYSISVPVDYTDGLVYRLVATTSAASDGEEMALPVLTNRVLVTESLPLNLRNTKSKSFRFEKLLAAGSPTLQNHAFTVEYTTNPSWYAVQALPYLMEYPYDCAEQTWNRFYANALATSIANSAPRIKAIFEQLQKAGKPLESALQKNQELKNIMLEETPWVLQAKTEAEQKRNTALLFDLVRMANESSSALAKLEEMQSPNGGFVWFKGGMDDRYMTQYIVIGAGHLQKLNAVPMSVNARVRLMVGRAIPYLDARMQEDYDRLIATKADLSKNQLGSLTVQYVYMRSFFADLNMDTRYKKAYDYYVEQARKYWLTQSKYHQGMIALALHRIGDKQTATGILISLAENSISHEEFGMYWKEFNNPGYYWWQAPIESHALLTEAFAEIESNAKRIDDLKTWLLKQKQTTNWKTTKATAEACYALLMQGTNWLAEERTVQISLGSKVLSSATSPAEAGTGYFKETIPGTDIKPDMGNISVNLSGQSGTGSSSTSWGAVYWQYFEDMDKVTRAGTPVQITKQLFVERNTDRGPVREPVKEGSTLRIGDKVKVRIEIVSDRNMEYVHLKDTRASCLEPVNVLSMYKYQGGLSYYESTRDANTNFFISYLPRGTYVFEYPLVVSHAGTFTNGLAQLQCMYAPEFTSHASSPKLTVLAK